MEEWRQIMGLPYSVSDRGRVRNDRDGHILKGSPNQKGYFIVDLRVPDFRRAAAIHSLVAETFLGKRPDPKLQINHINGVKTDNRITNLEYVTASENVRHAFRMGLINRPKTKRIFTKKRAKLDWEKVGEIRSLMDGKKGTVARVAKAFNVSSATISEIKNNRIWRKADAVI